MVMQSGAPDSASIVTVEWLGTRLEISYGNPEAVSSSGAGAPSSAGKMLS